MSDKKNQEMVSNKISSVNFLLLDNRKEVLFSVNKYINLCSTNSMQFPRYLFAIVTFVLFAQ